MPKTRNYVQRSELDKREIERLEAEILRLGTEIVADCDYDPRGTGGPGSAGEQHTHRLVDQLTAAKEKLYRLKTAERQAKGKEVAGKQPGKSSGPKSTEVPERLAADAALETLSAIIQDIARPVMSELTAENMAYQKASTQIRAAMATHAAEAIDLIWSNTREYQKMHPAGVAEATQVAAPAAAAIKSALQLLEEADNADTVFDNWEALAADLDNPATNANASSAFRTILEGAKIEYPFANKSKFEQSNSHEQTNTSRLVASFHLYNKAAKRCKDALKQDATLKPVVVDVGCGSFGAINLAHARRSRALRGVYFHAMMPSVDQDDPARITRAARDHTFMDWNCVTETHRVVKDQLNYCRHRARECDCLKYYSEGYRELIAIHSSYYFTQLDYDNLFKYANSVACAVHLPQVGETIPTQRPEFKWHDATQWGDRWRRFKAAVRSYTTNEPQVAMVPTTFGCTTYEHPDIAKKVGNGGFHVSRLSLAAAAYDEDPVKSLAKAAWVTGLTNFVTTPGPLPMKALSGLASGLGAAAVGAVALRAVNTAAQASQPPPFTRYTVNTHIKQVFSLTEDKDPLCKVVVYTKRSPEALRPVTIDRDDVDEAQVGRVTAGLLMAKEEPRTYRQLAASLFRDNVPARLVRGTLRSAQRLGNFTVSPTDHPPSPYSPNAIVSAIISLPFALGLAPRMNWTLSALLNHQWVGSGAIVDAPPTFMHIMRICLPFFCLIPLYVTMSFVVALILGLVLPA